MERSSMRLAGRHEQPTVEQTERYEREAREREERLAEGFAHRVTAGPTGLRGAPVEVAAPVPAVGDIVPMGDGFGEVAQVHDNYGMGCTVEVSPMAPTQRGHIEGGRFVREVTP